MTQRDRGRQSNRKLDEKIRDAALKILGGVLCAGFGPTLASEYLAGKHGIHARRGTVRSWMIEGMLWQAKRHRRSRVGDMVQLITSDHDWLEGRGPRLYLNQHDRRGRHADRIVLGSAGIVLAWRKLVFRQYIFGHARVGCESGPGT